MAAEIGKDKLLKMYRTMQTIRQFEERLRDLFKEGKVPGFVHVSIGEEASPTGVCAALTDKDYITSTHRGHGHLIAKGGRLKPMMAEIFGKSTGYCKGKGGSMHIADFSIGILGANGIVGAGLPIATGAGLSAKMRKSGQVAVCFFGDGASNEGTFHESLNIASSWKLPVVYVCENNRGNGGALSFLSRRALLLVGCLLRWNSTQSRQMSSARWKRPSPLLRKVRCPGPKKRWRMCFRRRRGNESENRRAGESGN